MNSLRNLKINKDDMKIELQVLQPDEFCLGFHLDNGEDELGQPVHFTHIGFLLFEIIFTRYLNI